MSDVLRLRLDISYEGTDFSGWAIQPDRRTVGGALTNALEVLLRQPVQLVVAGRTDAGVHALGQVAHADVGLAELRALAPRGVRPEVYPDIGLAEHRALGPGRVRPEGHADVGVAELSAVAPIGAHPDVYVDAGLAAPSAGAHPEVDQTSEAPATEAAADAAGRLGLLRRLAGLLPPDVRVRAVTPAPDGFDARFSALRRHYRYRIGTAEWGVEPRDQRFVLARRRNLDADAMSRAAAALIGLHDFAAFCRPRQGATTTRELQALTVERVGDEVRIDVVADAFCHSMVRALVGALLAVGEGRQPVERPAALLAAARRTSDIHVAPAHGLTLMAVDYPPDTELALRAEQTRARRATLPSPI